MTRSPHCFPLSPHRVPLETPPPKQTTQNTNTKKVRCLDDVCPHRGAPLSAGWLAPAPAAEGGGCGGRGGASSGARASGGGGGATCVVCPYHGWAFDGAGRLRDVPSAEPGRWPKRALLGAYDVRWDDF